MKITLACLLLAAGAANTNAAERVTLTVTHDLAIARPAEMIALPWQQLARALPGVQLQQLEVRDAAGHVLPYQVTNVADAAPGATDAGYGELLFQHDFAAGERSATFTVEKTGRVAPVFATKTFARYVPERYDDFAWENDKIAHRTYGPALAAPDAAHSGKEVLVSSGIDVWCKRVAYPVVDRWYNKRHYHHDDGEGMDMYQVGASRGSGGSGVWDGQRLYTSGNYSTWKILANGPIRTIFELSYAAWDAHGVKVAEVKRYTVDAGHNLDQVDDTYTFTGADHATVAIGINRDSADKDQAVHAEVARNATDGTLVQWETERSNGALGEAVVLPAAFDGYAEDASNHLLLARASSGRAVHYLAGAGWSKGGDFASQEDWSAYVRAEAMRARSPLTVTLSAP